MNLLRYVREELTKQLWLTYKKQVKHACVIDEVLQYPCESYLLIDHFAIIDLPSAHSGLKVLRPLFTALGYEVRGEGYLPDKQNGFMWMAEIDAEKQPVSDVLSQVVIADFELTELPDSVRKIIEKYTMDLRSPLEQVNLLSQQVQAGDQLAADQLIELLVKYFSEMDRPLPTMADFKTVETFNELLAWCLIFARKPNHFTIA